QHRHLPSCPTRRSSDLHAMLVDEGRVVAIGEYAELADAATGADVVDLGGRVVLPGFIDSHVHPIDGGQALISCDLHDGSTIDDYRRLVASYAAANPDREWIVGSGWSVDAFPGGIPSVEHLDGVDGGKPVFLTNRDGHSAWVNLAALRRAGITASTPDPP